MSYLLNTNRNGNFGPVGVVIHDDIETLAKAWRVPAERMQEFSSGITELNTSDLEARAEEAGRAAAAAEDQWLKTEALMRDASGQRRIELSFATARLSKAHDRAEAAYKEARALRARARASDIRQEWWLSH